MVIGLLIAILITYRKPREYRNSEEVGFKFGFKHQETEEITFSKDHAFAIIGALAALVVQLTLGSLVLGAILGLLIMLAR
ncbi:MAG: hypothetical protein U5K84_09455 [Alkalibacterium sp.]|nr:hypothetical protein [Alkalibacterium sp.]